MQFTRISLQACASSESVTGWLEKEVPLVDAMKKGITAHSVSETAKVFMVARQFPMRDGFSCKAERYIPVVEPLKNAVQNLTKTNLVAKVNELADALTASPDLTKVLKSGRSIRPISAASKFIWVADPLNGIVYDQWASKCLKGLGHRHSERDYGAFVAAFRTELEKRDRQLDEALSSLAKNEWRTLPWMKSKLLDFWLYENGKAMKRVVQPSEGSALSS